MKGRKEYHGTARPHASISGTARKHPPHANIPVSTKGHYLCWPAKTFDTILRKYKDINIDNDQYLDSGLNDVTSNLRTLKPAYGVHTPSLVVFNSCRHSFLRVNQTVRSHFAPPSLARAPFYGALRLYYLHSCNRRRSRCTPEHRGVYHSLHSARRTILHSVTIGAQPVDIVLWVQP